jgi:hypothetical protein
MAANHRSDHAWMAIRNMIARQLGDATPTADNIRLACVKVTSEICPVHLGVLPHYATGLGVYQIGRNMVTRQRDVAHRQAGKDQERAMNDGEDHVVALRNGRPAPTQAHLPLSIQAEFEDTWRSLSGKPLPVKGLCNRHQLRDQRLARQQAVENLAAPLLAHDVLIEIVDRGALASGDDLITPYELDARGMIEPGDVARLLSALNRA